MMTKVSMIIDFTLEVNPDDVGEIYDRKPEPYIIDLASTKLSHLFKDTYVIEKLRSHGITDYEFLDSGKIVLE